MVSKCVGAESTLGVSIGNSPDATLLRSVCPFDRDEAARVLPFEVENCVYLELFVQDEPLYTHVMRYISKQVKSLKSMRVSTANKTYAVWMLDEDDYGKGKGKGRSLNRKDQEVKMPDASIGLGWHKFDFNHNDSVLNVFVLHQRVGQPVGGGGFASFWTSIVLFVEGSDTLPLLRICQEAEQAATEHKENRVTLWRFDSTRHFWTTLAQRLARSIDSIVMEDKAKASVLDDLKWFLQDETRTFYAKHGIPYHRCYLFHGTPGTGKTSFIYSLAGHIQRNLCFMQMEKSMTDDSLRKAMSQLPSKAMVVLEDVDSLFTNHCEADHHLSSLSFSGFINCLDGLGAPEDVVIFLTSNHPERLDPAVMRPGRIDVKVKFKSPGKDVAAKYFLTFYPGADEAAATFMHAIGDGMAEKKISMAQLQHFFLACHRLKLDAAAAARHIQEYQFEDLGRDSSAHYN